ncbi:MAG: hypothetical protein ACRDLD_00410 [Thermoleophilaceae bacterium]
MAMGIGELARSAPKAAVGVRPVTTWREDLVTMALGFWPILAMMFDGRNHNNETGQESFFSLEHLFLYAGASVLGVWIVQLVLRHQVAAGADPIRGRIDLRAIPVGYGVALIGLGILSVAGPADLIWHELYGFEVNVDAIYSAPHLALFFGAMLVASTGIRSMWAKRDIAPDLRTFAPVLLSSILFIGVAGFITMYLSAFMTNVSLTSDFMADLERFNDVHADQTVGLNPGLTGYGDDEWPYYYYSASHGIASMMVTTLVLLGPILLLLRRWRVPVGSVTLIYLGFGLLVNIMTEYRDIVLIVPLILAGATIDLLQQRLGRQRSDGRVSLGGIRIVGPAAAAVLWISYFVVVALDTGIGWEPTLWVGALIVGIMTGFGVAFLIAPPAYGPRLVEGEDTTVEPA